MKIGYLILALDGIVDANRNTWSLIHVLDSLTVPEVPGAIKFFLLFNIQDTKGIKSLDFSLSIKNKKTNEEIYTKKSIIENPFIENQTSIFGSFLHLRFSEYGEYLIEVKDKDDELLGSREFSLLQSL